MTDKAIAVLGVRTGSEALRKVKGGLIARRNPYIRGAYLVFKSVEDAINHWSLPHNLPTHLRGPSLKLVD